MDARPVVPADGVAWVTGASSGIGRATALRLARCGFVVAASARDAEALALLAAEAAGEGHVIRPCPFDVTDPAAAAATAARIEAEIGPLALVVANAGIWLPGDGAELDAEDCRRSFRVNLEGTVDTIAPAIAAMRPRRRGQIAIVASVAGYRGLPRAAAYGATKAGLINLAESLRLDLAAHGILVQVVTPGFVDTPATRRNDFPMPFLMTVDAAADRLVAGLGRRGFEITFPRRFAWLLKLLQRLPYGLYFPLVRRATGL